MPRCDENRCIGVLNAGRVTLPGSLLAALNIKKGDLVTVSSADGELVIEKLNRLAIVRGAMTGGLPPASVAAPERSRLLVIMGGGARRPRPPLRRSRGGARVVGRRQSR